jgi:hypothetical protein
MTRHILRVRGRPPTEFANEPAVSDTAAAALPSATGREEGLAEDETLRDFQDDVLSHEGGARPVSEVTGGPQGGTPDENEDGLDEVERALQEAAEAPIGRREVGR